MKDKLRFLVVDDNKIDQLVSRQLLKTKFGITDVTPASNGNEALEWLAAHAKDENCAGVIVLLDIKMPEMDGFTFLEAFDRLEEGVKNNTRIIMVSSTLDPVDIERAEKHKQVKKLLTKPLPIVELTEYLTSLN